MFDVLEEERAYYPSNGRFFIGDKVTHTEYPTFGVGTVLRVDGNVVSVNFPRRKKGPDYRAFEHFLRIHKRRKQSFLLDDKLFEI